MKTSKTFSTISYLTENTLRLKLDNFQKLKKISFWAFIEHFPEEDEKKKHKHLLVMPNGQIDTDTFLDELVEIDLTNPLKPLKCLPVRSSKFGDWYLYSSHNEAYLTSKGQKRQYHYCNNDFIVSDEDFFIELIHQIDMSKLNGIAKFKSLIESGKSFGEIVSQGSVPIQLVNQYSRVYDLLSNSDGVVERNGNVSHTPYIDKNTGEVIPPIPPKK